MIRAYKSSDITKILEIWLEASIEAHDFIDSKFWKSKVDEMRDVYIPSAETYVYEEKGIVKGFVSLSNNILAAIFVSPKDQGKGIGMQLMQKVKDIRNNLSLTVYKENKRSINFYIKCGFSVVQEQTDSNTGHQEFVMTFNS